MSARVAGLFPAGIFLLGSLWTPALTHAQPEPAALAQTAAPADASGGSGAGRESEATNFSLENSLGLRDPFSRPAPKGGGDSGPEMSDLERFELDKFKLVGVITGPKKNKALITTPEDKMIVVSEGMAMGTRRGKVKRIYKGHLSVEEKVVNLLGQEENIETVLDLKAEVKK